MRSISSNSIIKFEDASSEFVLFSLTSSAKDSSATKYATSVSTPPPSIAVATAVIVVII